MVIIAALYAAAMAVLTAYGLNLLWLAAVFARHDRLRPGGVTYRKEDVDSRQIWPIVTVQIPLYNEALVAERVIDTCAVLQYARHRLEIQILDDSDDETTAIAERCVRRWQQRGLDIRHIRRTERSGFKAGALQEGLHMARGEFIVIFDADFVPPVNFLLRALEGFDRKEIGMVQARWEHLNADDSLLTRVQAYGLDTHFALEQYTRNRAGYFMNFNGTAGMWRRECIEDAGGWQSDTLTEDLDLSYRAQLRGWQFRFFSDMEAPAELPVDLNALRSQQFRWTKGAAETALKTLGQLWRSTQPGRIKIQGTMHLTAHLVFPALALVAVLHAPLLTLDDMGRGPGDVYFAVMGLGLVGFLGFFVAQALTQRQLYPDWGRRLLFFPLFMAGSMGMAINNTRAIWQALRGRRSEFVRTPKRGDRTEARRWRATPYADRRIPGIAWLEALLAIWCAVGLVILIAREEWAALPFQAAFVTAFAMVSVYNVRLAGLGRS